MNRIRNLFLVTCLLLGYHAHSQNEKSVIVQVASIIPDSIPDMTTIILKVHNFSKNYIDIYVPIMHVDYKVLKKDGNDYVNMDSPV